MLEALITELEAIEDPRCGWKVEHRLLDILVIAVCAVLGEAESFEDIALYGRCKHAWLKQFLALPNGIPSHDTFRRVFMLIDPDAFERSFLGWVRAVFRPEEDAPRQVAIDGKAVRRSFDRKHGRSPLHLVSAYATEGGIVLAQRATETKGGELAVLPDLLDGLDLAGCLVSLDALACRPEIAERITARGGDYLLALKGNRKKAHAEVKGWFAANAFALGAPLRPCFDAFDDGHGRLVRRRVFACPDVDAFATLKDWPGLAAVLAVETIRGVIPTALIADCYGPAAAGDRGEPVGHGHQRVPGLAAGRDDRVVVRPDAQAEPVLPQVLPDVLDGIQLGRAGRQRQERDVVGDGEVPGAVPSGAVEDHEGVCARGDVAADLRQVQAHGLGVDAGQDEAGADGPLGADRADQVRPGVAAVPRGPWAGGAPPAQP